jgi:hypothetical protein
MEDITRRFFNIYEPCPIEIQNCHELRNEYIKTLDSLKVSGCAPCAERNLKNKFIVRLKEIIETTQ